MQRMYGMGGKTSVDIGSAMKSATKSTEAGSAGHCIVEMVPETIRAAPTWT